jgi:hypothetical protein
MLTLDEVIEGMEHCHRHQCRGCPGARDPEGFECVNEVTYTEPLRYLKEYRDLIRNDVAEVAGAGSRLCCGSCGEAIFYGAEVCPHCGRKLNWAALEIRS